MRDDILFKGLRADNKELIYGSLVKNTRSEMIVQSPKICKGGLKCVAVRVIWAVQYIGKTDIHGVKIFDNDCVKGLDYSGWGIKGRVGYNRKEASFGVYTDCRFYPMSQVHSVEVVNQ